jgi:DNA-directed RNA polymerase specialized sigma24 family protein
MYEIIRRKLIRVFAAKRCVFAEDLADETFNRVARRLPQIKEFYVGDPLKYFFGVARKIYLEYLRSISAQKWVTPPLKETVAEVLFEHLEDCIGQLQHKDRELILTYYQGSGRTKIDRRKLLAEELGIPIGALRLRVHRIVSSLRKTANSRQTDALLPNASLLLD